MAAESDETATDSGKKSGGGLINLALLAVVCGAGSFGAIFFLTPSGKADPAACVAAEAPAAHAPFEPLASEDQTYVELQEILITIGNEPATRFIKIKTSVVSDSSHADKVKKAEPMLVDAFVTYLRSLELSDFESAAFFPRLREQLARRSELVLGHEASRGVLVTEFLLR